MKVSKPLLLQRKTFLPPPHLQKELQTCVGDREILGKDAFRYQIGDTMGGPPFPSPKKPHCRLTIARRPTETQSHQLSNCNLASYQNLMYIYDVIIF